MADAQDPFALNIRGVTDLIENPINKVPGQGSEGAEGVGAEKRHVLSLEMPDEDLLKLRDKWEADYAGYEATMKTIFERNLESYLGKRKDGQWLVDGGPTAANLQFEAEETFLAAALSKNPEPIVYCDNSPEGNAIATAVKTMLQFHSDELVIRHKLKIMVRQWSIFHLGVLKLGWNSQINDVSVENRRVRDFIFDKKGYVNAYAEFVGYLGERISVTAERLAELFPESKAYITLAVDEKMGTEVTYTEWWTDEYCFVTFKDKVLDKFKNPYFKYEEKLEDQDGEEIPDEVGNPQTTEARNHFAVPRKPYTFLSVYSLQEQPHDITSNIEQNIANQTIIRNRTEQIDFNVGSSNNGYAYSGDNFNQETAKQASTARKKGNPILIPSGGPIDRAILPLPAQPLPEAIFREVEIAKNDLRASWGVQGITAEAADDDQTARGMILNQSHDTSRIGGGIGSSIEQVADNVFNWLVQLYHVFYDEKHFAAVMGNAKAVEYVTISNAELNRQLIVSVAPDSLRPRDEVTNINLAQALFDKGAIGPKTLLKMVDFPNPDEAAADGVLYKLDPMAYLQMNFPDFLTKLQEAQQARGLAAAPAPGTPAPVEGGMPPEDITEPKEGLTREPASAALSNVPLPA